MSFAGVQPGRSAMIIFGAVTFGSLIKTFLPGLVWLIAFAIVDYDLAKAFGYHSYLWDALADKDRAQTIMILSFPASILVGLLSNVVVFMGLNDLLIRNPFKRTNRELSDLHTKLSAAVRDKCWAAMAMDPSQKQSFDEWTDPEIIIVERIGADKLAYVREQYWYHLEFQLNLLISLVGIFVALGASILVSKGFSPGAERMAAAIIVCAFVCYGLLKAARKNYERHIAKMASLMTALLSQDEPSGA
jgi:hypothetical protein